MTAAGLVLPDGRRRLAAFLAAMTKIVDGEADEAELLTQAAAALQLLVAHDDWLDEQFARPDANYRQYLLYCDPLRRFSIVSFVWGPGQDTPVHDHTVWGLVGMLRGAEISEAFELRDGKPVSVGEERLEPGQVLKLSPRIGDIHRVRNALQDGVSISIHVYGGDIGSIERHVYLPEGGSKPFVSGYSNAYLPNVWGQL